MQKQSENTAGAGFGSIKSALITGASGLIGGRLVKDLSSAGVKVIALSRYPNRHAHKFPSSVRWISRLEELDTDDIDLIINLAGESLASGRWTEDKKRSLMESRAGLTKRLYDFAVARRWSPKRLISASAVGFYGSTNQTPVDEATVPQPASISESFSHQLCQQWEHAARQFEALGTNVTIVRLGVVFAPQAPAFKALVRPFHFKVASYFGDGEHYLSWIHLDDVVRAMEFVIHNSAQNQTFNLTSPEAVSYRQFAKLMGRKKSCLFQLPLPGMPLKCLMGQMADELLLKGQNVYPKNILDLGFEFKFGTLQSAVDDLM